MDEFVLPRTLGRGRTYVYLLPWREQDLLKVGFSRQPLQRMRRLHRRFFEVFDLDRGLLLEAGTLAQARRIERAILLRHQAERAPAPLVVPDRAAGYREWLRGVSPVVSAELQQWAEREALPLHTLRDWLQRWYAAQGDALYEWSLRMLEAIEYETFNLPAHEQRGDAAAALRYLMDACEALGLAPGRFFAESALAWRQRQG